MVSLRSRGMLIVGAASKRQVWRGSRIGAKSKGVTSVANTEKIKVDTGMGTIWVIGWLFTIAYAKLSFWTAVLGMFIWPYYLGVTVR